MNPPTPAAVRGAMKPADKCTPEELDAFRADPRSCSSLLLGHMHEVAGQMRNSAKQADALAKLSDPLTGAVYFFHADTLREFADKLEGLES